MTIEQVFESRRIRYADEHQNTIDYYRGEGSNYPKNGSYLDPNSEYQHRFKDMASWIVSTFKGSGMILDVGGATGNLGYWINKLNLDIEITHTDFSYEALDFSKNRVYTHTPIQCDAQSLPFRNKSFEGIVYADVLEHLKPSNAEKH